MIISIIGGGATGITMLRHLAELAGSTRYRNLVTAIRLSTSRASTAASPIARQAISISST